MMQERLGTSDQNATGGDSSQEGVQNISRISFLERPSFVWVQMEGKKDKWVDRRSHLIAIINNKNVTIKTAE